MILVSLVTKCNRIRGRPGPILALSLAATSLAVGGAVPEKLTRPSAAWADRGRLAAGEILVHVPPSGPFRDHVQAAIAIDATPQQIWRVVTDCDRAPEFVPGVLSCERVRVLEPGRMELFRQSVKYSWYLPRMEYEFRLEYFPYEQLNFRRVSGSLKRLDGTWWLEPMGNGQTLVFYSLDLDPGFLVPAVLVRRALRKDLPRVLASLRERVSTASSAPAGRVRGAAAVMAVTSGTQASCYGPAHPSQTVAMTPRILIAETDRHTRSVLRRYVVKGWRGAAVQATSVELEELLSDGEKLRSFDVLLAGCDFSKDGTSNNPTLLTVRALAADPRNPPIILLTEAGSEYTAVQAIRAGAADCVPKGLMGREQVVTSIQRVLRRQRGAGDGESRVTEFISLFGYDIRRRLAHHDNASVHVAYSAEHGKEVVLKILHRGRGALSRDQSFERFVAEFKLLYDVDDPAVAEIYDFRVTPKYCYIAMEYFPLGHLGTRLSKAVSPDEALELIVEIAHALSIIHAAGVIHLDLKPGNIMLRDDGTVALIDFEISKSALNGNSDSLTGEVRGTPYYISPEQARGEKADERSDIYALGIMLYEMLTGRKPYLGDTTYAILEQHTSAAVPQLAAPMAGYQPLLEKLLAKQPAQRLANARELMEAVEEVRAAVKPEPATQASGAS